MARQSKPGRPKTARKAPRSKSSIAAKDSASKKARKAAGAGPRRTPEPEPGLTAADALARLLESPLVAELIAAGAAAALATITQSALSKRGQSSTGETLKKAARAAAGAIRDKVEQEFDEIVKAAKERGSGPK